MDKTIKSSEQNIETPIDQKRYALVLKWSARIGLFSILFTFFIYISGLISPVIPLERLPHLWVRNSMFLNESFGIATGWGWMSLISKSDMMAKAALTFLACVPILCYLSVLPIYVKKKEIVMVFIVLMEISILILAASGLLKVEYEEYCDLFEKIDLFWFFSYFILFFIFFITSRLCCKRYHTC